MNPPAPPHWLRCLSGDADRVVLHSAGRSGIVGQRGRKGNQRGLGVLLITIGVILLALVVGYPHA